MVSDGDILLWLAVIGATGGGIVAGMFLMRGPWVWWLRLLVLLGVSWMIAQVTFQVSAQWVVDHRLMEDDMLTEMVLRSGSAFGGVLTGMVNVTMIVGAWLVGILGGSLYANWKKEARDEATD